jgi:hypothetical protein
VRLPSRTRPSVVKLPLGIASLLVPSLILISYISTSTL